MSISTVFAIELMSRLLERYRTHKQSINCKLPNVVLLLSLDLGEEDLAHIHATKVTIISIMHHIEVQEALIQEILHKITTASLLEGFTIDLYELNTCLQALLLTFIKIIELIKKLQSQAVCRITQLH